MLELPDGRILVVWNNHGDDQFMRAKVSLSSDIFTLTVVPEQNWNVGFDISYGHLFLDRINSTSTTFIVQDWTRNFRGDGTQPNHGWSWEKTNLTISVGSNTIIKGATLRAFSAGGTGDTTRQMYAIARDTFAASGQILRFGIGFNPASPAGFHGIWGFEYNVATGAITNVMDPAMTAVNVLTVTNAPVIVPDQAPMVTNVAAGNSRRFFDIRSGPADWAVVFADWNLSTPATNMIKMATVTPASANPGVHQSAGYGIWRNLREDSGRVVTAC